MSERRRAIMVGLQRQVLLLASEKGLQDIGRKPCRSPFYELDEALSIAFLCRHGVLLPVLGDHSSDKDRKG